MKGNERMTDVLETSDDERYRVRLEADCDPPNPREEFDHLVHVITLGGQRYIDVDPDGGPLEYGWEHFSERDSRTVAVKIFTRWARIFHDTVVVEHRPLEGAWSLWYMTPKEIAEISCTPEEGIASEIAEYRSWVEREVFTYIIEESGKGQQEWEEVDSCGGFYGLENARFNAREAFAHRLKHNDWE